MSAIGGMRTQMSTNVGEGIPATHPLRKLSVLVDTLMVETSREFEPAFVAYLVGAPGMSEIATNAP